MTGPKTGGRSENAAVVIELLVADCVFKIFWSTAIAFATAELLVRLKLAPVAEGIGLPGPAIPIGCQKSLWNNSLEIGVGNIAPIREPRTLGSEKKPFHRF